MYCLFIVNNTEDKELEMHKIQFTRLTYFNSDLPNPTYFSKKEHYDKVLKLRGYSAQVIIKHCSILIVYWCLPFV